MAWFSTGIFCRQKQTALPCNQERMALQQPSARSETTNDRNTGFRFGGEVVDNTRLSDADFGGDILKAHHRTPLV
jgi:hypothetical protein